MFLDSKGDFRFFIDVFNNFWGTYILPILFLIALAILYKKKCDICNKIFINPFIFLLITVYNPVVMYFIMKVINISERYYRFYWLTPVALIVGVAMADLIGEVENERYRLGIFALAMFVCLTVGVRNNFMVNLGNVYNVSQDTIDISYIIQCDKPEDESKVVFADMGIVYYLRMYDGTVMPLVTRTNDENSDTLFSKPMDEIYEDYCSSGKSYVLIANRNVEYDSEKVRSDLEKDGAEYFVRNKLWYSPEYMNALGFTLIGESENYEVYRVE